MIRARLTDVQGRELSTASLMLPAETNGVQLTELARTLLLQQVQGEEEKEEIAQQLFSFAITIVEDNGETFYMSSSSENVTLASLIQRPSFDELALAITVTPQALFRVRPVTRCTSTLEGHLDSVLSVAFSPDGTILASASGDCTIRLWEVYTGTTIRVLKDCHRAWVISIAWSPDGKTLASGAHDGSLAAYHLDTSSMVFLKGHTAAITQIQWQPLHLVPLTNNTSFLLSASKDHTVRIWNPLTGALIQVFSQHSAFVTSVRWSISNIIFTGARDRLIHFYRQDESSSFFRLAGTLKGHAHWINHMALSSDALLRTGDTDPRQLILEPAKESSTATFAERVLAARRRVEEFGVNTERMVSSSDDSTLILWNLKDLSLLSRLTGHQGGVTQASFSPDGRWIASCSFDRSIKLWDGITGSWIASFRGHVAAVYQIAWSADSRMLISGSKDSTVILWNVDRRAMKQSLAGHRDEVYAVDWASNGQTAASGSKDRAVRLWRH